MRKARDLMVLLQAELPARYADLRMLPGSEAEAIEDLPGQYLLLDRTGGPGLDAEGVLDVIGWRIESVGDQGSYDDAEDLADAVDRAIMNRGYSRAVNGTWMVAAYRQAGPPQPVYVDTADRHHFACGYLFSVDSALAP